MIFREPAAIAGFLLELLVAVFAAILARRMKFHRPFAILAIALALIDPARAALHLLRPFSGHGAALGRVLMGLDVASAAVEPLGLLVAAVATWEPRWWAHAAGASLACVVGFLVRWPWGPTQGAQLAVQGAALAPVAVLFVRELRRRWLRWAGRPSTLALATLAAGQLGTILGPWLAPSVWAAWRSSWPGTIGIWAALAAAQAAWLADERSSPSGPAAGGAPL